MEQFTESSNDLMQSLFLETPVLSYYDKLFSANEKQNKVRKNEYFDEALELLGNFLADVYFLFQKFQLIYRSCLNDLDL